MPPFSDHARRHWRAKLTKLHEEVRRGPLDRLAAELEGETLKGEAVLLVGQGSQAMVSDEDIARAA